MSQSHSSSAGNKFCCVGEAGRGPRGVRPPGSVQLHLESRLSLHQSMDSAGKMQTLGTGVKLGEVSSRP